MPFDFIMPFIVSKLFQVCIVYIFIKIKFALFI